MSIFDSLIQLEDQLDRQQLRAATLEREAGDLARKLADIREAVCSLLKEIEENRNDS